MAPTTSPAESAERAVSLLVERAGLPQDGFVLAATGVGIETARWPRCGYPVRRVSEINAIGRGGIGLGGGSAALVASLGTGTAMVSVRGSEVTHVTPGNGVGGGTLLGLSRALLGTDDLAELAQLASPGRPPTSGALPSAKRLAGRLGTLPEDGTAANFAKYARGASPRGRRRLAAEPRRRGSAVDRASGTCPAWGKSARSSRGSFFWSGRSGAGSKRSVPC